MKNVPEMENEEFIRALENADVKIEKKYAEVFKRIANLA
jgi:hypothetical protein